MDHETSKKGFQLLGGGFAPQTPDQELYGFAARPLL